jgi:subtilisin family serine protease
VDSGVEADHPDLEGCVDADGGVMVTLDEGGEPVLTSGRHDDAFGHGTACAGIIHRLAPEASITSVRVLGSGLAGKAVGFLAGLGWAIDQGFDVINLSLGTTKRDWALSFYEVCDRAYFGNSFIVTAANNIARPSFPSLYASVTSVACNLSKDPLRFHYNPDPPTEFLARGIDIEVSWQGGSRITGTGNSYAAPHIAGIAALIKSKHPQLRPFQVKTALWAGAANVQEAPAAAGRLTNAMRATRLTMGGVRATSAMGVLPSRIKRL